MSVSVRIPAQVCRLYGAQSWEQVESDTMAAVIASLDARYPGLGERLTEPDGQLRRWVNVFVDGFDVRTQEGMDTALRDGAEVFIVPSVAGGVGASADRVSRIRDRDRRNWSLIQVENCTHGQCGLARFVLYSLASNGC